MSEQFRAVSTETKAVATATSSGLPGEPLPDAVGFAGVHVSDLVARLQALGVACSDGTSSPRGVYASESA
jgi:hypothetical protein